MKRVPGDVAPRCATRGRGCQRNGLLALCGCLRRAPGASLDVAAARIAWRHLALRVRTAVSARHRDAPSAGFTSQRVNVLRRAAAPRAAVCIRAERMFLAFSDDVLRCAAVYVVRWCVPAPVLHGCIRMASRCSARCCPFSRLCGCRTFGIFAKFRQKVRMLDALRAALCLMKSGSVSLRMTSSVWPDHNYSSINRI